MRLPAQKTKIVCTIGPASESPAIMKQMIESGMNVAQFHFPFPLCRPGEKTADEEAV